MERIFDNTSSDIRENFLNKGLSPVRIYISSRKYTFFKLDEILQDNDSFFSSIKINLDDTAIRVIKIIDKAEVIDKPKGLIRTPFGETTVDNLSTGCKTVLNYLHLTQHPEEYRHIKAIDATCCGWNALEELFKQIQNTGYDIAVILKHENKLYNCSIRDYMVNNTNKITDLLWL